VLGFRLRTNSELRVLNLTGNTNYSLEQADPALFQLPDSPSPAVAPSKELAPVL